MTLFGSFNQKSKTYYDFDAFDACNSTLSDKCAPKFTLFAHGVPHFEPSWANQTMTEMQIIGHVWDMTHLLFYASMQQWNTVSFHESVSMIFNMTHNYKTNFSWRESSYDLLPFHKTKKRKNEPISQQFTNPPTQLKPLLMIKLRSGVWWFNPHVRWLFFSTWWLNPLFFCISTPKCMMTSLNPEQQWLGQLLFWVIWLSHIPLISPWNPVKSTSFHRSRLGRPCVVRMAAVGMGPRASETRFLQKGGDG